MARFRSRWSSLNCINLLNPNPAPVSQLTVVVKYFFQFGFFPWTTSAYRGINADRPFALPNIIGVEKKDGYVLFDLIQLLALFFHRSILKVRIDLLLIPGLLLCGLLMVPYLLFFLFYFNFSSLTAVEQPR